MLKTPKALEPCPVCGYEAATLDLAKHGEWDVTKGPAWYVYCQICGNRTHFFWPKAGERPAAARAIEAWNRQGDQP